MIKQVHVTNEDFYIATEWRIIKAVREAEKSLKDTAQRAAVDVGVTVDRKIPVEGYYGMKLGWNEEGLDNLREYFFAVKALQEGTPSGTVQSDALHRLDDLYHHPAFGIGPERPTPYHPQPENGWSFRQSDPRFLSGVVDGIYLAMRDKRWSPEDHNTQAIVQRAVELQHQGKLGTNLVALATLVDDKEHSNGTNIDPVCLTYSLFTTVLSRAEARGGAPMTEYTYHWDVDPAVEELGAAVVDAYNNALMQVFNDQRTRIKPFHEPDAEGCSYATNASDSWLGRERVVRVDSDDSAGVLHWAVRYNGERFTTVTFIAPQIVDPCAYKDDPTIIDKYHPLPAVPQE